MRTDVVILGGHQTASAHHQAGDRASDRGGT